MEDNQMEESKTIERMLKEGWQFRCVFEQPLKFSIINKILRHCINAVLVILLVSILFKVNIVINVENMGKLILMASFAHGLIERYSSNDDS